MFCQKCGAEIVGGVCPRCAANEDAPPKVELEPTKGKKKKEKKEKVKKPIYKRPWFIILIVIIVFGAIGQAAGGGTSSDGDGQTVAEVDSIDDAKRADTAIYGMLLSAQKQMNQLSQTMSDGSSELTIYDKCKSVRSTLGKLSTQIQSHETKANKDYVEDAGNYILMMQVACDGVMDYIDKHEMKYLSDAKSDIETAGNCLQSAFIARQAYLMACGMTEDEIAEYNKQFED